MRMTLLTVVAACLAVAACASKEESRPPPPDPVTSLALGEGEFSCAVFASGAVRCWGLNDGGQLGNAAHVERWSRIPVAAGTSPSAKVSAGGAHVCALLASGAVSCWGWGVQGQLGNGVLQERAAPVAVTGLTNAIEISSGMYHSCALLRGGAVKCWGGNEFGQLGDPSLATTAPANRFATPVDAVAISGAQAITTGTCQTCALLGDGTARCWGGRMNGDPPYQHDPVAITSLEGVLSLTSGNCHNCALVAGGKVKCWGWNDNGQLGNGTVYVHSPTEAVFVTGIDSAIAVAAGSRESCAVLAGGTVACWGENGRGQVGDAPCAKCATPVVIPGITGAVAVAVGYSHACALLAGGTVKCWGENMYGQLGLDPALVQTSGTPVTITF